MTLFTQIDTVTSSVGNGDPALWTPVDSAFAAWAAAVNPSNVGAEVALEAASTSANNDTVRGVTFSVSHPTAGKLIGQCRQGSSATTAYYGMGTGTFTPGSTSGLGIWTTLLLSTSKTSATASSGSGEVFVVWSDVPTKEFFCVNNRVAASTTSTGFMISKTSLGTWFVHIGDDATVTSSQIAGGYVPGQGWTAFGYCPTIDGLSSTYSVSGPITFLRSTPPPTASNDPEADAYYVQLADPRLRMTTQVAPFVPRQGYTGDDWLTLGRRYIYNFGGLI